MLSTLSCSAKLKTNNNNPLNEDLHNIHWCDFDVELRQIFVFTNDNIFECIELLLIFVEERFEQFKQFTYSITRLQSTVPNLNDCIYLYPFGVFLT